MHQLSTAEMVAMVLAIVVSLAAMEAVIFIFGARSYSRHEADRKDGEAQDTATSARHYLSQHHNR